MNLGGTTRGTPLYQAIILQLTDSCRAPCHKNCSLTNLAIIGNFLNVPYGTKF